MHTIDYTCTAFMTIVLIIFMFTFQLRATQEVSVLRETSNINTDVDSTSAADVLFQYQIKFRKRFVNKTHFLNILT